MRREYVGIALTTMLVVWLAGCNSSNYNPPAELIAPTSGSSQSAQVNTPFGAPLVATVTMGGQPVSGAFVVFTAPSSGASGTFSNGTNTETDTTGSNGVVTSSTFTANRTVGAVAITASVAGVTATTTFSLTNTSGPPASISATSGSLQSATIDTAFGAALVATVVDANQYPVSGVTVTFTVPAAGASAAFANGTTTDTETTNANGMATSTTVTANGTTGSYSVAATVAGVATAASFNLSNVAGALISIAATGGTPQSARVNTQFTNALVATVMNGGQQPVSGVQVTFTAPATGTSGTFANGTDSDTETTNASGMATSTAFTANGGVGTYTVTATVASGAEPANFTLTNTAINFAFYVTGLEAINGGSNFYGLAGSVQVDGNGDVLGGEQDYNDGFGVLSPQPSGDTILPETGALTVDSSTGLGTLVLTTNNANLGVNGVETLAVQFVNANHALIAQFDGSATSSGSMDAQTLSSTLNDANYAFTLSGVDTSYLPIVFGGVFSISSSGTALSGTYDVDDAGATTTPTLGTAFSGTITGPDSFGRGTISGALGISLNYYVVGPETIRIIDVDSTDAGVGSVFGQGTGTFGNASLGASVFGVQSNSLGSLFAAAGMFTVPTSGTISGVADVNEFDNDVIVTDAAISGTYTVAGNGYGSLTIAQGDLGDVSVLGIYLTDPNLNLNDPNNTATGLGGALIADLDGFTLNGSGVLTPQTDTSTAGFAGSYGFEAQAFHNPRGPKLGWEFDFVGQGAVNSGALNNASGLLSDPFFIFNATGPDGTDTAKFTGTAAPDPTNAGRYTMKLGVTAAADPVNFNSVIYQASAGQLFWLNTDTSNVSVFLGMLQQQGSLTTVPASAKTESGQGR
jgi:hypothetical protein